MGDWIPDTTPGWWKKIENYGFVGYVRRVIVRFILGGVAGIVFSVAGIIRSAWNTFADTFGAAGATLWGAIGSVGSTVVSPIEGLNTWVFHLVLGNSLGFLEGPFVAVLYLAEFAIVIRLAKPTLLTVGELATAIPVVGGLLNGGITFLVSASDSLWDGARRTIGGIA